MLGFIGGTIEDKAVVQSTLKIPKDMFESLTMTETGCGGKRTKKLHHVGEIRAVGGHKSVEGADDFAVGKANSGQSFSVVDILNKMTIGKARRKGGRFGIVSRHAMVAE